MLANTTRALTEAQREQWAVDGYLQLEGALSPAEVDFFSEQIDPLNRGEGEQSEEWAYPAYCAALDPAYFCLSASRTAATRLGSAASGGMPARSTCNSWPTVLLRVPQPRFIASVSSS